MASPHKKRRSKTAPADLFVQLRQGLRQTEAWRSLSYAARSVYIELAAGIFPHNNGRVERSVRFLADVVPCSTSTVQTSLKQLEARGFIVAESRGSFDPNGQGLGTLWRITEVGTACDPTPTKDYKDWRPPKNKTLYRKSTRGVAKSDTLAGQGVANTDTGCSEYRHRKGRFEGSGCSDFRHKSNLPGGDGLCVVCRPTPLSLPRRFTGRVSLSDDFTSTPRVFSTAARCYRGAA